MNYTTAVFLINKDLRALIGVYEDGGKRETFKTLDHSIKVGDLCVVPSDTRHKVTTVKVLETDVSVDFDAQEKVRWIITRIDMDAFAQTVAQEDQAIEALKAAEFKKRRDTLFKDLVAAADADKIKALPIYKNGEGDPPKAA